LPYTTLFRSALRKHLFTAEQICPQGRGLVAIEHADELPLRRPQGLDEDLDVAAACEPDLECNVVGDAEGRDLRGARFQDLLRLLENGALDAAVGNRARHLARTCDEHLGARRPRPRPP